MPKNEVVRTYIRSPKTGARKIAGTRSVIWVVEVAQPTRTTTGWRGRGTTRCSRLAARAALMRWCVHGFNPEHP